MHDGDPQPAFLHGISTLLPFLWTELRNHLLSKHGKEIPAEELSIQSHRVSRSTVGLQTAK